MTGIRRERPGTPTGRRYSRRDFLKAGGAGLAGAALLGTAGCGGGSSGGGGEFVFSFGPDTSGTLVGLVKKFNEKFKGQYKATYRQTPSASDQYFDQLRTQFQAGSGDIALIGGDVIWTAQFAINGYILDLSDRFPESDQQKFLPGPIKSNTYEGKPYGVPWFTDAGVLYYRKDLLEKSGFSGPPKTWDELKQQAKTVQQDSGIENGFVFQGAEFEGGVVNGLEYINSYGGSVLDPNDASKITIDSPESAEGLATQLSMVEEKITPQAVTTYKEPESDAIFLNGEAVFERSWPYVYALVGTEDWPKLNPDQVGIAPLPAGSAGSVSGLGGWNFFINSFADSETQDAAFEFAKFATAPEQQKYRAVEGAFLPVLKSSYEDQEVVDALPAVSQAGAALERTEPRPISPYYSDMSLEMAEQFTAVLNGDLEPEQAVATLQEQLQSIVESAQ